MQPYALFGNDEVFEQLKRGFRLKKPDECNDALYAIMHDCWQENPEVSECVCVWCVCVCARARFFPVSPFLHSYTHTCTHDCVQQDRPTFYAVLEKLCKLTSHDVEHYLDPRAGERPEFMPASVYARLQEEGRLKATPGANAYDSDLAQTTGAGAGAGGYEEDDDAETYDNQAVGFTPEELDAMDDLRDEHARKQGRVAREDVADGAAYDLGDGDHGRGDSEAEGDANAYDLGDNGGMAVQQRGEMTEEEMDANAYDLGDTDMAAGDEDDGAEEEGEDDHGFDTGTSTATNASTQGYLTVERAEELHGFDDVQESEQPQ